MRERLSLIVGAAFFVFLAVSPLWLLRTGYLQGLGFEAITLAAMAVAWNIVGGLGGRLSFGHAAFFGIGAYTSTLLVVNFGISPWLGGIAGMVISAVVALGLGSITTHLRGVYFTLVTFVFSLLLVNLARHFTELTGGDVGLSVPLTEPSFLMFQFRGQQSYYYIALITLVIFTAIAWLVMRSSFGYKLRSVRDDVDVARALGVKTEQVKLRAFVLSAVMVSFVGTLTAQHDLFIDPTGAFGTDRSVEMALGAIFGGAGTLWGPVIGGIAVVVISQSANNALQHVFAGADVIVYGLFLIAVALWLPGGLVSIPRRIRAAVEKGRRKHQDQTTPVPPRRQASEKSRR
ncbi:branched-chain amino acid ABC transporter permease [Compostimonas suwonensis]|uniref:Branched-chain amino acid transport system permease protein n=1 Tax=Compostimonas suwonensis TaxID=1048394 RepID=A0A2M9BU68_9MICO|nr:branched-chain amino acid ABC transporter permease [Compostimonas suwonensis]PJJ61497.1 branched-chain amino acid transport system permease protein [Compostimonas suwonensis]